MEQRNRSSSAFPVIKLKPTPGTALLPTHTQRIPGEKASLEMQAQLWHTEWTKECFEKKTSVPFSLVT